MKDIQDLLVAIEHTAHMVAAIHTLGASLAAGMHAGVVEPHHLQLLLDSHAKAISGVSP